MAEALFPLTRDVLFLERGFEADLSPWLPTPRRPQL